MASGLGTAIAGGWVEPEAIRPLRDLLESARAGSSEPETLRAISEKVLRLQGVAPAYRKAIGLVLDAVRRRAGASSPPAGT
jgi:hypothetical protein